MPLCACSSSLSGYGWFPGLGITVVGISDKMCKNSNFSGKILIAEENVLNVLEWKTFLTKSHRAPQQKHPWTALCVLTLKLKPRR